MVESVECTDCGSPCGKVIFNVGPFAPHVLPAGWWRHRAMTSLQRAYVNHDGLRVIITVSREADGKRWLHVSCSHQDRLPSWDELREVKDIFIGRDELAVQVLPSETEYVNHHPYVLHLWHCLDGRPLPDFRCQVAGEI